MANVFKHQINLLYCYASKDKTLREELEIHMSPLKHNYQLKTWSDRQIDPGGDWEKTIHAHLNTANLILLLISPDFMASEYCYGIEMRKALALHEYGSCRVIPILMRPTYWKGSPFSTLQMLPTGAKPVTLWTNSDEAFADIVTNIDQIIIKELLPLFEKKEEWLTRGNELYSLQYYEEALQAYERAINLVPNDIIVLTNKGNTLYNLDRYEEALQTYEQVISLDPKDTFAYYNKGNALESLKRYEEALQAYERAIRLNPNYVAAYNNKGITLDNLKRYEEALQAYERAISLNPRDAIAYSNKGDTLNKMRRYKEALQVCQQAIHLNSHDAIAYNNKGDALSGLKKYEEALQCYEEAIRLQPNDPIAYYSKGRVLSLLKRDEEALQTIEKANQLTYNI